MLLAQIKTKTETLRKLLFSNLNSEGLSLRDHIILEYSKKIIRKLETILAQDHQGNEGYVNDFQAFLEENWNLVKGSLLAYTALPRADITLLLCDIANYVAENTHDDKKRHAICALMPGVAYASYSDNYPNLNTLPLSKVITTHILSDSQDYLIPIALLGKIEQENIARDLRQEFHPYYDSDVHGNRYNLTSGELDRLSSHSSYTHAVSNNLEKYQQLLQSDNDSLLGRLNQLIQALSYNGTKGIGMEHHAGEGGYLEIVSFMEYYARLEPKKIPLGIKTEIELISNLASDYTRLGDIDSCFAKRSEALKNLVSGNEPILAIIKPIASKQESAIADVLTNYHTTKQQLNSCLEKNNYTGEDSMGITARIFHDLRMNFKLRNYSDLLTAIKGLNTEEIEALTRLKGAPRQISKAIASVENLVSLFTEFNQGIMAALLESIKNDIQSIIKEKRDFSSLLIPLTTEQCSLVCQTFKELIPKLTRNASNLGSILDSLNEEKQSILFNAIKEQLPQIIKSASDFSYILESLSEEQRSMVFNTMKEQLPQIITSGRDISDILIYLTEKQRSIALNDMREQLSGIVENDPNAISNFSRLLTSEQSNFVLQISSSGHQVHPAQRDKQLPHYSQNPNVSSAQRDDRLHRSKKRPSTESKISRFLRDIGLFSNKTENSVSNRGAKPVSEHLNRPR